MCRVASLPPDLPTWRTIDYSNSISTVSICVRSWMPWTPSKAGGYYLSLYKRLENWKSLKLENVFVKPTTLLPNPLPSDYKTKNLPSFINLSDDSGPQRLSVCQYFPSAPQTLPLPIDQPILYPISPSPLRASYPDVDLKKPTCPPPIPLTATINVNPLNLGLYSQLRLRLRRHYFPIKLREHGEPCPRPHHALPMPPRDGFE